MPGDKPQSLYIIDGNSYVHRAFHALPELTDTHGRPVNAVYGFVRMLTKVIHQEHPDYLTVCFDHPEPTFRHRMFPEYKAQRKKAPPELVQQIPVVEELVKEMSIPSVVMGGYEADDLIGTLAVRAKEQGIKVVIVTGDKDALQLVDGSVSVLNEPKNIRFDGEKVKEYFGVMPVQFVDLLALMGDSSDNIQGVPGIGEKTARILIDRYGSLDGIYANIDSITGHVGELLRKHKTDVYQAKQLVTIVTDVPIKLSIPELRPGKPDKTKLLDMLEDLGFKTLVKEFQKPEIPEPPELLLIKDNIEFESVLQQLAAGGTIYFYIPDSDRADKKIITERAYFGSDSKRVWLVRIKDDTLFSESCSVSQESFRKIIAKLWTSGRASPPLRGDLTVITNNLKLLQKCLLGTGAFQQAKLFDTMLASWLLDPDMSDYKIATILKHYTDWTQESPVGHRRKKEITSPEQEARIAALLPMLEGCLLREIETRKQTELLYNIEIPLAKVLAAMELSGIKIDLAYLKRLSVEFEQQIEDTKKRIYGSCGHKFNVNSSPQLAKVLFEELHLVPGRRTKTHRSTAMDVLEELKDAHPIVPLILGYRELQKLKSTYVDILIKMADADNGRVHTSFNQTGTATGRLSSTNPNLQNIPVRSVFGRQIRNAFVSENGWLLLSADYSQIDLRVLAHISQDKELGQAFMADEDIHRRTAAQIFQVSYDSVSEEQRTHAKRVNFGISYGMTPYGLSEDLAIDVETARAYIEQYFHQYPGVKKYMAEIVADARQKGFVETLLGRRRYVPDLRSKNDRIRRAAERVAINAPIQGSSSDIIKLAMLKIQASIEEQNLISRMLLQVHDELLFEVPENELEYLKDIVIREMTNACPLRVPLVVNIKEGDNWAKLRVVS
jgi:DNA polymerase-1